MSGWLGKPDSISWWNYLTILAAKTRYQPLVFPGGDVIERKCHVSIIDSREKAKALCLPEDFSGRTVLDIGCAEGFFTLLAARRGATRAIGCDLLESRLRMARIQARAWGFEDRVRFSQTKLYDIPKDWASDVTFCLAMAHHLHGGFHDTWAMIADPEKHADAVNGMLKAVEAVSSLTREVTYWEYSFEYEGDKPADVDHARLGDFWQRKGLYERVEFIGLSQNEPYKDRALYRAFKA